MSKLMVMLAMIILMAMIMLKIMTTLKIMITLMTMIILITILLIITTLISMIIVMSMIILIVVLIQKWYVLNWKFFFPLMSIFEQFDICRLMLAVSNLSFMLSSYHDELSIDKL